MKYFEKPGRQNSDEVIAEALAAAREKGIKHIVVASGSGRTAEKLIGCGLDVTVVTYQAGFKAPHKISMAPEMNEKLRNAGFKIYSGTHFFGGAGRAMNRRFGGLGPGEMMAHTLRILGHGIKVCVEISIMALDSGNIPYEEEIIAIGGTGGGADTAVIIQPAYSHSFFDTQVLEIICMPRTKRKEEKK